MFTQKCFIRKNSNELHKKIHRLGDRGGKFVHDCTFLTLLVADIDHCRCYDDEWDNDKWLIDNGYIDCGTNEELFLALAALRDDTDYMQYFICGDNFVLCDREDWLDMYSVLRSGNKYSIEELDNARKATAEEIIEHFKKE